jgi:hypothetical protein
MIQAYGKKGATPAKFEDFMFNWDIDSPKEEKVQSVEDMKRILMNLANSQNSKKGVREISKIK